MREYLLWRTSVASVDIVLCCHLTSSPPSTAAGHKHLLSSSINCFLIWSEQQKYRQVKPSYLVISYLPTKCRRWEVWSWRQSACECLCCETFCVCVWWNTEQVIFLEYWKDCVYDPLLWNEYYLEDNKWSLRNLQHSVKTQHQCLTVLSSKCVN